MHQSSLHQPSQTPALHVKLFSRAERGYPSHPQTPCPSASLFLLFQVNHNTIFISRPRQGSDTDLLCLHQVPRWQHHAFGETGMGSCPKHVFIRAMILTTFSHCFVIHCSSKRGINTWQALEGVLCMHCMVRPPHSAMRVIMTMPQPIHTDRRASHSRGNEQIDNRLLKRKMLRRLGPMAICILSLISAVPLYCI